MELSINKHILDLIHKHHTTNGIPIAQARPMSVFDVSRSLLAKLSFNHPSVALTADVFFQFLIKPNMEVASADDVASVEVLAPFGRGLDAQFS